MQKQGNDQATTLVAHLCRADSDGAGPVFLRPESEAWGEALTLLEHHRLAPWVWSRARRSGALESLPAPLGTLLGEAHRGAVLAHFSLLGELRRIEAAFAGNGVSAMALKGVGLFTTLYEEPGLRQMEDMDFLVRPEHLWAAGESLAAMGYTPVQSGGIEEARRTHFHLAYRSRSGAFRVEIHWGLDDETFLSPAVVPDIWDRSANRDTPSPRLDPVAEFLYLCIHAAKHGVLNSACARTPGLEAVVFDPLSGNRLIWLLDLKLLMERAGVGLDEVRALAVRWRVETALHSGVVLAQHVFGPVAGWTWTGPPPAGGVSAARLMVLRRLARGLSRRGRATISLMRRLQKPDHLRDARPARGLDLLDLPFPNQVEIRGWRERHGLWAIPPLALTRFADGIAQAASRLWRHFDAGKYLRRGAQRPKPNYIVVCPTVDRFPKPNYIDRTLESLEKSGFFDSELCPALVLTNSNPARGEYLEKFRRLPRTTVTDPGTAAGLSVNAGTAIVAAARTGADYIIVIEDDIIFCNRWIESIDAWLRSHASAEHRLFSFFTPYREVTNAVNAGRDSWEYPLQAFYGAQCWAVRGGDGRSVGEFIRTSRGNYDVELKQWVERTYPQVSHHLASCPSFVQHIGLISALGSLNPPVLDDFPGEEWSYVGPHPDAASSRRAQGCLQADSPPASSRFAGVLAHAAGRAWRHLRLGRKFDEQGGTPQTIWQTYKTKDLPPAAKRCRESWLTLNPGWRHEFHDDTDIEAYVRSSWGERMAAFHAALPLGVMKADLWRYLILCDKGGVYSDVDTVCLEPLDRWIDGGRPRGADVLIVGLENPAHFCQWTIAATPRPPGAQTRGGVSPEKFRVAGNRHQARAFRARHDRARHLDRGAERVSGSGRGPERRPDPPALPGRSDVPEVLPPERRLPDGRQILRRQKGAA